MTDVALKTFEVPSSKYTLFGESLGLHETDSDNLIQALKRGLPVKSFEQLRGSLGVTKAELAEVVDISERTLARRLKSGRFTPSESERIYRIARIFEKAVEVLEDNAGAAMWLKTPKRYFQEQTPLQYADTEVGARRVEQLLGRLEHGIFS